MLEQRLAELRLTVKHLSRPGGPQIWAGDGRGPIRNVTDEHIDQCNDWIAELECILARRHRA